MKERIGTGLRGLARLAQFSPYAQDSEMTVADLLLWIHAGLVGLALEKIHGENLFVKHVPAMTAFMPVMEAFSKGNDAIRRSIAMLKSYMLLSFTCLSFTAQAGVLLEKVTHPGFVMPGYAITRSCTLTDRAEGK